MNCEDKKIAVVIVSSGRWSYLNRTVKRLRKLGITRSEITTTLIVNNIEPMAKLKVMRNLKSWYPDINHKIIINDSSHCGLVKAAMKLSRHFENTLFLEEDWLLSKNFNFREALLMMKSSKFRQFVFSKYKVKRSSFASQDDYLSRYRGYFLKLGSQHSSYYAQDILFSLNPNIYPRKVANHLYINYPWHLNLSGYKLELSLGEFLSNRLGPSIIDFENKDYKIKHIGFTNTPTFLKWARFYKGWFLLEGRVFINDLQWIIYLALPQVIRKCIKSIFRVTNIG